MKSNYAITRLFPAQGMFLIALIAALSFVFQSCQKSEEKLTADKAVQQQQPQQQQPQQQVADPLLANLKTAFEGESNASERYAAFAIKADEEGYPKVAALFRAASRAEKIHAANHADVIKKLGAKALANIKKPDVKTTEENLKAAIEGENYEKDTMYPDFIKQAKEIKNKDAMRTFNLAKEVETQHSKLYTEALNSLPKSKGVKANFMVCKVCGSTIAKIDFDKCPVCFEPKSSYFPVN